MSDSQSIPPSNDNETLIVDLLDGLDYYINLSLVDPADGECVKLTNELFKMVGVSPTPYPSDKVTRFLVQFITYFRETQSQWVISWAIAHPNGLAATFLYQKIEGYLPDELNTRTVITYIVKKLGIEITKKLEEGLDTKVDVGDIVSSISVLKDLKQSLYDKDIKPSQEYIDMAIDVVGESTTPPEINVLVITSIAILIFQIVVYFIGKKRSHWIIERAVANPRGIISRIFISTIIMKIPVQVRNQGIAIAIISKVNQKIKVG